MAKTKDLCKNKRIVYICEPSLANKNGNYPNLRDLRNETPTVNNVSFHLELNAALICYAAVNLWCCNRW